MATTKITSDNITDGAITSAKLASGVGGVAGIVSSADATAITIDSSENVGIGTASPVRALQVGTHGTGNGEIALGSATNGVGSILFGDGASGADIYRGYVQYNHTDDALLLATNAAERMRIGSNGYIGMGTTTTAVPLTINLASDINWRFLSASSQSRIMAISDNGGTYKDIGILGADLYFYADGVERMKLDANNLFLTGGTDARIVFGSGGAGAAISNDANWVRGEADSLIYNAADNGSHKYEINGSEAMRIDSAGKVGIGTTAPATDLHIHSTDQNALTVETDTTVNQIHLSNSTNSPSYLTQDSYSLVLKADDNAWGGAASAIKFNVKGSEAMRIDNSGHLLVGKTAASIPVIGTEIRNNGEIFSTIANAVTTMHVYSTNGAYRFYVTGAGQIHATSTSISSLSDERLKENITDLETGLTEVMSLQPRRFDWKNGDGENVAGFIAQEVETILPDLIGNHKHDSLADAKSLRMGDMLPTLVKAMQEQQTIIEDLKSRLETLENA